MITYIALPDETMNLIKEVASLAGVSEVDIISEGIKLVALKYAEIEKNAHRK